MTTVLNATAAEFLNYNLWANLELIEACLKLTPEQLARSAPGTYGSIYNTLVHLIQAEVLYYQRLTGILLEPPFAWESNPSLTDMRPYAEQISRALVDAAAQIQFTDMFRRDWNDSYWEGRSFHFKKIGLLIQVVNHGVEHRTNITTILAQLGIPELILDGWEYMRMNQDRLGK